MEIGATIKRIRKIKGISQSIMSDKCNISQTYISQLENDIRNPTINILEKIGNCLEIPYGILIFLSLTEEDIPSDKIESYLVSRPIIKGIIETIFVEDES